MNAEDIRESWWEYLVVLYGILKTFQRNIRRDAEERMTTGRRGCGLRLFSLLPLSNFRHKFITIDTDALHAILDSVDPEVVGVPGIPEKAEFRANALWWWNHVFHLERVTTERRRFAFSIATDGVGCSVHVRRPKAPDNRVNDWGFDLNGDYQPLDVDEENIVGLDPGRRELFVAVGADEEPIRCSNARWREISGARYSSGKISTWMDNNSEIQGLVRRIPTPCVYTVLDCCLHMRMMMKKKRGRTFVLFLPECGCGG